jgi:hypothetical protein
MKTRKKPGQRRTRNPKGRHRTNRAAKVAPKPPLKVFTLYIGTTRPGARERILHILQQAFPSFTLIEGEGQGYFQGSAEPMWLVRLATETPALVLATAEKIRAALHQDDVGIEYANCFYRCTPEDRATELQKRLEEEEA